MLCLFLGEVLVAVDGSYISSIAFQKEPEDGEGRRAGGRGKDPQGRRQLHAAPSVPGCRPSWQHFTLFFFHICFYLLPKSDTVVKEVR